MSSVSAAKTSPFAPVQHFSEVLGRLAETPNHLKVSGDLSYPQFARECEIIALGWIQLGAKPGDRIVILSRPSLETLRLEVALVAARMVPVPIHPSSSAEILERAIRETGAQWLVLDDSAQEEKLRQIQSRVPHLNGVLALDPSAVKNQPHSTLLSPSALVQLGKRRQDLKPEELKEVRAAAEPEETASIILTTGQNGESRWVAISHRAQAQALQNVATAFGNTIFRFGVERMLGVQSHGHVFGRLELWLSLLCAWKISFSRRRDSLPSELQEFAPTLLFASPATLIELHDRFLAPLDPIHFGGREFPRLTQMARKIRDPQTPERFRDFAGGALRMVFCGGGALPTPVRNFYRESGIPVVEGYGLTETAGPVTATQPEGPHLEWGSVGHTLPGNEIRIDQKGEIWVRSNSSESLEWIPTGDLGRMDSSGAVRVLDRVAHQFSLSTGETVIPAELERRLEEHPWIEHAYLAGKDRPYVTALIQLRRDRLVRYAQEELLLFSDWASLLQSPRVVHEIQKWVESVNSSHPQETQVRRFLLISEPFTFARNELTLTHKVIRSGVEARRQTDLDILYPAPSPNPPDVRTSDISTSSEYNA